MPIKVTPFIFLLNMCNGILMAVLFVTCSVHKRISINSPSKMVTLDNINISLAMVLNSLFLVWSLGCLLGSYFGAYAVFMHPIAQAFKNLLSLEMIIDIIQKTIGFLVLGFASLQMGKIKNKHTLVPWASVCIVIGLVQSLFIWTMIIFVLKSRLGWITLYIFSGVVSLAQCIFSGLSWLLINRSQVATKSITGYLPNKTVFWNRKLCFMVLISGLLDFLSKAVFVLMETGLILSIQLLADISLLARTVSSIISVISVYTARIPCDKPYSKRVYN